MLIESLIFCFELTFLLIRSQFCPLELKTVGISLFFVISYLFSDFHVIAIASALGWLDDGNRCANRLLDFVKLVEKADMSSIDRYASVVPTSSRKFVFRVCLFHFNHASPDLGVRCKT